MGAKGIDVEHITLDDLPPFMGRCQMPVMEREPLQEVLSDGVKDRMSDRIPWKNARKQQAASETKTTAAVLCLTLILALARISS